MTSITDVITKDLDKPYIVVDGDSAIHFMRGREILLTTGAHINTVAGGKKTLDTLSKVFALRGTLLLEMEVRWSQNLFKLARGIPPTTVDGRNYVIARYMTKRDLETTTDVFVIFVTEQMPVAMLHATSDGRVRVAGYECEHPNEAVLAMFKDLILPYVRTVVTDTPDQIGEPVSDNKSEEVLEEIFPDNHPPVPAVETRGVRIARWMVITATFAMAVLVAVVSWSTKG